MQNALLFYSSWNDIDLLIESVYMIVKLRGILGN